MGLRAILLKWDRNISRDFETFVLFLICTRTRVYSPLGAIENSDTVRTSRENQRILGVCVSQLLFSIVIALLSRS